MKILSKTELDIYDLMDIAKEKIDDLLPNNMYTDDWQWNDRAFQFIICKLGKDPMHTIESDPYRFIYNSDEELYGSAEEQLDDWIKDRFSSYKHK